MTSTSGSMTTKLNLLYPIRRRHVNLVSTAFSSASERPSMIYTFYSYKGGVGRSMALANVAELFYRWGLRVLMLDFDLEAPGLERFFEAPSQAVRGVEEIENK